MLLQFEQTSSRRATLNSEFVPIGVCLQLTECVKHDTFHSNHLLHVVFIIWIFFEQRVVDHLVYDTPLANNYINHFGFVYRSKSLRFSPIRDQLLRMNSQHASFGRVFFSQCIVNVSYSFQSTPLIQQTIHFIHLLLKNALFRRTSSANTFFGSCSPIFSFTEASLHRKNGFTSFSS